MKIILVPTTLALCACLPIHADQQTPQTVEKQVTIQAPIALGEFFDKLTILMIKRQQINDTKKRCNIDKEYEFLNKIYTSTMTSSPKLQNLIDNLYKVNRALWTLEDLTREKERNKEFDENFKQSVKAILENNDTRFTIKRSINMLLDSPVIEEKSYKKTLSIDIDSQDTIATEKNLQKVPIITVPISLADLLDRISILEIKMEKIQDAQKQANVQHEYETLLAIYRTTIKPSPELDELYSKLLAANKRMWDIQDKLRAKVLSGQLDEEFIQLGRSVYYTNDERVRIKQMINTLFNSALIDEKMYAKY